MRAVRHRRLRMALLGSAVAAVALVAIGLTPGIRHSHSGGDVPHRHVKHGHSHPHSHTHSASGARSHSHSHSHAHEHGHHHAHGRSHHHGHAHLHAHGAGHPHHHRPETDGRSRIESHAGAQTAEVRPHTHFSLWGFTFTIFDRSPDCERPTDRREPAGVSETKPPQPRAAAEESRQVVEFRNGWTSGSVELAGLPLVTLSESVSLAHACRSESTLNLEDEQTDTRRDSPALPPPERDRGSLPLDFIRRLAPRA